MAFLVEMPDGGFLEVEERSDLAPDDLSVIGILGASPLEGTGLITFGAVIRAGLDEDQQDDFADWIFDRVMFFAELGGDVDGWERLEDGTWRVESRGGAD